MFLVDLCVMSHAEPANYCVYWCQLAARRISIQRASWRDGSVKRRLFSPRKDEKSVYRRSSAIFTDCLSWRAGQPAKRITGRRPRSTVNAAAVAVSSGSISTETPAVVSLPHENDVRHRCTAVWSVARCPRGARWATDGRGPRVTWSSTATQWRGLRCLTVIVIQVVFTR